MLRDQVSQLDALETWSTVEPEDTESRRPQDPSVKGDAGSRRCSSLGRKGSRGVDRRP
jgi:hypothetical protein